MFAWLDEAASYILYQLSVMASFARFLLGEQINAIRLHLSARGSRRELRLRSRLVLERWRSYGPDRPGVAREDRRGSRLAC